MVVAVGAVDVFVSALRLRDVSGVLEGEVERRPVPHPSLSPHPSAVAVDDALHGGKPYARTLELARPVQALEGAEQLVGVSLSSNPAPSSRTK